MKKKVDTGSLGEKKQMSAGEFFFSPVEGGAFFFFVHPPELFF